VKASFDISHVQFQKVVYERSIFYFNSRNPSEQNHAKILKKENSPFKFLEIFKIISSFKTENMFPTIKFQKLFCLSFFLIIWCWRIEPGCAIANIALRW
jgi:hypothetical protein